MGQTFQNIDNLKAADISNGQFTRDGSDLIVKAADGSDIIIEQYFSDFAPPTLLSTDGAALTPNMVDAFLSHQAVHAQAQGTMSDIGPIAEATDIFGEAIITRADGTKVTVEAGTPIFQGDVIETIGDSAMSITFADDTTFAISEQAKLSIDEYVFDQADNSGSSFFSMLKGSFVYTSGLIGKDNPDSVNIETPAGSIGIRGTVVMGRITPDGIGSEIVIIDGAIIVSNAGGTMELNTHLEAVQINGYQASPVNLGAYSSQEVATSYQSLGSVAKGTFQQMNIQPEPEATIETESNSEAETDQGTPEQGAVEKNTSETSDQPSPIKQKIAKAIEEHIESENIEKTEVETKEAVNADGTEATLQTVTINPILTDADSAFAPIIESDATTTEKTASYTTSALGTVETTQTTQTILQSSIFKINSFSKVNEIREFAEVGTFVADIGVNRSDVTYSITAGNTANIAQYGGAGIGQIDNFAAIGTPFAIDSTTGRITVSNPNAFFHGLNDQFTIEVTIVENQTGKTLTRDINFNVADLMQGAGSAGQYYVGTIGSDSPPFAIPGIDDPTTGRDVIWGMSGDDTIISDSGSDILFGGIGNDTFELRNDDFRHVNGDDLSNSDTDTVIFTNNGTNNITYDLTTPVLGDVGRFRDIDVFQISGASGYNTTLILDEDAILDMTDGGRTINITGSAYNETIDVSSISGMVNQGSGVYTNGSVTLIVDASVDTVTT